MPLGVGEVIGRHGMFLMPEEVQLLAVLPGSTLHRLLIDPATGRCTERTIPAYRFDKAMREQIIASDLFCRAPGCLRPARLSQLDHVQEHGTPGGHTCEANGQPACEPHHDQKTKKAWDAVLHANRDVTWTTLLGRIYRTKAHDYRQYTKLLTAATNDITDAITNGADRARVIDDAIYQALSYRDPGSPLAVDDEEDLFHGWDTITLTHRTDTGRRTYAPDPETRQTEANRHRQADTDDTQHASTDTADGEHAGRADAGTGANPDPHDDGSPWTNRNDEPPPF